MHKHIGEETEAGAQQIEGHVEQAQEKQADEGQAQIKEQQGAKQEALEEAQKVAQIVLPKEE